jgi:hypothetical protein
MQRTALAAIVVPTFRSAFSRYCPALADRDRKLDSIVPPAEAPQDCFREPTRRRGQPHLSPCDRLRHARSATPQLGRPHADDAVAGHGVRRVARRFASAALRRLGSYQYRARIGSVRFQPARNSIMCLMLYLASADEIPAQSSPDISVEEVEPHATRCAPGSRCRT